MSNNHFGGNAVPEITREEHDGNLNAKRVSLVSAATLYVVSNVGSAELSGNVTLNPSPNFIGIVTVANPGSAALSGNVTLDAGSKTQIVGNLTLSDPKGFIGLVTVVGSLSPASGNVTLDPGSRTGIVGNLTLSDSKGPIGLVTVAGGDVLDGIQSDITTVAGGVWTDTTNSNFNFLMSGGHDGADPRALMTGTDGRLQANVTVNNVARSILGNLTLSDSKGFIGLTTVVQSSIARTVTGNLTLSDSKTFIGLTTVVQASSARTITGNLTLSDSKGFVGLVTAVVGSSLPAGTNAVGNVGLVGRTSGGLSIFRSIDLDETEEEVKATSGQVFTIAAFNRTAAPLYLKLYNATTGNVTVGITTPVMTFVVPGNADSDGAGLIHSTDIGYAFGTAITAAATTGVADNDTGAPGANECVVNIGYV